MKKEVMRYFGYGLLVLGMVSCQNDDDGIENPATDPINDWMFNTMTDRYLWTDEMPSDPDRTLATTDFFNSLLFSGDRFSRIFPDYDQLISQLDGVVLEAGYELSLVRESGTDNVLGVIIYVKEGSPAQNAGLKRGDIIRRINNTTITLGNYQELLQDIAQHHTIDYDRYNFTTQEYEPLQETLSVVQLAENPHFLDSIYTIQNGKKVGYYIYNFFSPGVGASTAYNDQMDDIFAKFQAGGIDELVVDLRYNGGGSVDATTNLASLIAPDVTDQDVFYRYQWNELYQGLFENDPQLESALSGTFRIKAENIGNNLASGRVFVLVGPATASASELIINGLTPYMDVVIIGGTTVGKNVSSIPFEDEQNPDNDYGLLPIVFRVANSLGQSDYEQGFVPGPEYTVSDIQFPLQPLGDIEEPLLATALAEIEGQLTGRRRYPEGTGLLPLTSTLQLNPLKNEMVLRDPALASKY